MTFPIGTTTHRHSPHVETPRLCTCQARRPPCIVCRTWHQTPQTPSVSPQQTRTTQAALIAQARADVRQAEKEPQAALRARRQGKGTVGAYGRAKQKVETCLRRLRRLERKRGVP